ncbi:hypothetical protein KP509_10G022500 [Ceratopteris richardii]|uniref:Telomere-associated protein Rif1 N-terminal domain-containing protein n=1 Tax=Ceratopteris richardii TaxID=49495 RepID=A0A8T2TVP6_CERRI|nr:hypothetical protein KP509_10G022500 [Ceratopteris richardii]
MMENVNVQHPPFASLLEPKMLELILSDISSSNLNTASLALKSLLSFLHIKELSAEVSNENASAILSSICQLIMSTDNSVLCSLAVRCLSIQEFNPCVIDSCLDSIFQGLLYVIDSGTYANCKSPVYEALQGLVKVVKRHAHVMVKASVWAPAIYKRLLSADKKERDVAEQCLKDLESVLALPPQRSFSEVVALDVEKVLLPKLEKMVKFKSLILPAVRAWSWFVKLLGGLAGEKRTLINRMLKIVEFTFTNQDASIRRASLIAWEALIDGLLQLPNSSELQNTTTSHATNSSSVQFEKPVLAPPLKRLKLLMVPLLSLLSSDKDQMVRLTCWHTWQYLVHRLGAVVNQLSVANIVVIPLFEVVLKFGPEKYSPSPWDLCLKAIEDWLLSKFQNTFDSFVFSQALSIGTPEKPETPKIPTDKNAEKISEGSLNILWASWSLNHLDAFLRLIVTLWTSGMRYSKTSCSKNLFLSSALRFFFLLVKGVEAEGKGVVEPPKQHIDSVHSLLTFVNQVSVQYIQTVDIKEVLLAVDSLIESLSELQPLILASSFYKLSLTPLDLQRKLQEHCNTFQTSNIPVKPLDDSNHKSAESVTPIVYLLHSWLWITSFTVLAGPDREIFLKRLESLIAFASGGFNIMGNLCGLLNVLEFCLSKCSKENGVCEVELTAVACDTKVVSGNQCLTYSSKHLLICWKMIAEYVARYLEGSNDISAAESVVSDSEHQMIFRILLFPFRACMQLNSAYLEDVICTRVVDSKSFANTSGKVDVQTVLVAWMKLFDQASVISTRLSLQTNSFPSAVSRQILKLLGNKWHGQTAKALTNRNFLFADTISFVSAEIIKRTEPSNLTKLAINRKKRFGNFIGMPGLAYGVFGCEAKNADSLRDVLLLASRVLDLSYDNCLSGETLWLDPAARVLEALATLSSHFSSQHDVLMFLQIFSKPYAKWLMFTENLHSKEDNASLIRLTECLLKAWDKHLHNLQNCHPPLSYDSNLLSLQAPALVSAFKHPQMSISSCTYSYWEATYGNKETALTYPPCIIPVFQELKDKSNISLPGWNKYCADPSKRRFDFKCYTYARRRHLQMFQDGEDVKTCFPSMSVPLPNLGIVNKDISSEANGSSNPRGPDNSLTKATDYVPHECPAISDVKVSEANSSSLTCTDELTSKATVTSLYVMSKRNTEVTRTSIAVKRGSFKNDRDTNSLITSKNDCSVQDVDQKPVTLHIQQNLNPVFVESPTTSFPFLHEQNLLGLSAAATERQSVQSLDPVASGHASSAVSQESLLLATGHGEVEMTTGTSDGYKDQSNCNSLTKTTDHRICEEDLNCPTVTIQCDDSSELSKRILKGSRVDCTREMKTLGIRQLRFLRSSGLLRGGKHWRNSSGMFKSSEHIGKYAGVSKGRNMSTDVLNCSTAHCLTSNQSLIKHIKDRAFCKRRKIFSGKTCFEKSTGNIVESRRLSVANVDGALNDIQSVNESVPVRSSNESAQQVFSSDNNACFGISNAEISLKRACAESPFRVQTLSRGLDNKIFALTKQCNIVNQCSSRSHHRKNSFPRRIPILKDEQNGNPSLKPPIRKRMRKAEPGFEFTTPSKILRSGRKLKSLKCRSLAAAEMEKPVHGCMLQNGTLFGNSRSANHSTVRTSALHSANVPKNVLLHPDMTCQESSNIPKNVQLQADMTRQESSEFSSDLLQEGEGHLQHLDGSGKHLYFRAPILDDRPDIPSSKSCDIDTSTESHNHHKMCGVLADLSTSSEWSSMSLDDLECAERIIAILHNVVDQHRRQKLVTSTL